MFSAPRPARPSLRPPLLLWAFLVASVVAVLAGSLRSGLTAVVFAAAATAALAAHAVTAIREAVPRRLVLTGILALGVALIVKWHPALRDAALRDAGLAREQAVAVLLLAAVAALAVVVRRLPRGPRRPRRTALVAVGAALPLALPVLWLATHWGTDQPGEAVARLSAALPGLLGTGLAVAVVLASVRRADRRWWLVAGALLLEGLALTQLMDVFAAFSFGLHAGDGLIFFQAGVGDGPKFLQPGVRYSVAEQHLVDRLDLDAALPIAAGLAAPALLTLGVARATRQRDVA